MRLNQFLALAGAGSRREADGWIREGRVRINGALPTGMGPAVDPRRDRVTLDGRLLVWSEERRYLAYHKPPGLLVSRRSQGGHRTVFQALGPVARGLHAVGRLDLESEGLLLLTNDGVLAEALLHPRSGLLRVYQVWVRPVPDVAAMRALREGTTVEGAHLRANRILLEGADRGSGILRVELLEGKKREIRVLAGAAGLRVMRLLRIAFGPIHLETLSRGESRSLRPGEVRALRHEAELRRG